MEKRRRNDEELEAQEEKEVEKKESEVKGARKLKELVWLTVYRNLVKEEAKIAEKGWIREKVEEELTNSFKNLKLKNNDGAIFTIKLLRNKSEDAIDDRGQQEEAKSYKFKAGIQR